MRCSSVIAPDAEKRLDIRVPAMYGGEQYLGLRLTRTLSRAETEKHARFPDPHPNAIPASKVQLADRLWRGRGVIDGGLAMLLRPLRKSKPWWDTGLARHFAVNGYAARLWVDHFFPRLSAIPANDRDHISTW